MTAGHKLLVPLIAFNWSTAPNTDVVLISGQPLCHKIYNLLNVPHVIALLSNYNNLNFLFLERKHFTTRNFVSHPLFIGKTVNDS